MYTLLIFAENSVMVTIALVSAIFFVIFCPITIKLNFYYDKKSKKLFFGVNLYELIRIIGGYLTIEGKYFAIHLSKKKAIIIDLTDIMNTGKKYAILKHFEIYSIRSVLQSGLDKQCFPLIVEEGVFIAENVLGGIYSEYKPFAICKNDIILTNNSNNLSLFGQIKVAFNLFVILIIILKKILEKTVNVNK